MQDVAVASDAQAMIGRLLEQLLSSGEEVGGSREFDAHDEESKEMGRLLLEIEMRGSLCLPIKVYSGSISLTECFEVIEFFERGSSFGSDSK